MSYTTSDILAQLNLSEDSSLYDLINKLNTYNLVTNDELANIINISVKPLPNIVRNQADVLKQKMYGIATNEEFGLPVVINRRIVLLQYISKRLIEYTERTDNPHNVTASQVGSYSKEEMDTILQELEEQLREEINNVKSELQQKIDNLQNQINTLSGNVGDINIGDLNSRLTKVEKLLDSDDVDLDTLQEVINVLKGNELGVNKSLYNLGAYDTISNGVITRKTGYVYFKDLKELSINTNSNNCKYIKYSKVTSTSLSSNYPIVNTYSWWNSEGYDTPVVSYDSNDNQLIVLFAKGVSDINSIIDIAIQYELANSYTENVIEGQPLITLDQNGSNWLREEWEKGINLGDFNDREGKYWVSIQNDITDFINSLPVGTYRISADITPLELDDGYSISDCFTWIQVTGGHYIGDGAFALTYYDSLNQTKRSELLFTKQNYTNYGFYLWGIGNHNGGNHGKIKVSNIMITKGNERYPYVPYNQSKHITNQEANFLKEENLKSANLCNGSVITATQIQTNTMGYATLENGKTYTFRITSNENSGATTLNIDGEQIVDYLPVGDSYTFIAEKDYNNALITCYFNTANTYAKAMLNEGSEAMPYQEYQGSIVRSKELEKLEKLEELEDIVINVSENADGTLHTSFDFVNIKIPKIERYLMKLQAYSANSEISTPYYLRCTRVETDESDGSCSIYFENEQKCVIIDRTYNEIYQENLTVPYAVHAYEADRATTANNLAVNTLTVDKTTSTVNDQVAITKTGLYAVVIKTHLNSVDNLNKNITIMLSVYNLNEEIYTYYTVSTKEGYIWYSGNKINAYRNETEIIDCKLITKY